MKSQTAKLAASSSASRFGKAMIAPTLLVMLVMTAYPLVFTLFYSFTDYNYLKGTDKASFVLFDNFTSLFANGYFRQAVVNTIVFTLLAVLFEMALGLLAAVFVNGLTRGQKMMRTLLLLPYLLPAVTVALSWRMMLSSNYGIVNQALSALGLPVFNWFMDTKTAFGTILLIDVWQNVPFVFLLLYASLQSVSESQYEAARIDGAGAIQRFRYVTLPNIKGSLALCALLRTIDTFRLFEKVNVLTGGGPAGTTSTITQYLYNYGIKSLDFGFGSAGAIVMTLFGAHLVKRLYQAGDELMDALKLTFVNVGYGEAVLLECPDRTRPGGNFVMVIDGGSAEPMEYLHTQSGRIRLAEYLQSHVDHIDIMVNTHPHEDHVSGLCAAARLFPPQQLWQTLDGGFCRHTLHPLHVEAQNDAQRKCLKGLSDWQDLMGQVVLHGGAIRRLTAGDDVRIANGFTVRALAPDAKGTAALEQNLSSLMAAPAAARAEELGRLDTALNNFSLILLVEYHGFRILLPGDTNAAGYGSIPGGSLQADLFKVGHHGQRDGADLALLQKVRPQAVICCASSDRRYGSADPGLLDMAAKQGAKVYCSDCPELPAGMPVPPPHHALVFRIWKDRKWDARYE